MALVSPWKRREKTPRLLRRMENGFGYPVPLPADAAGANRQGLRAPTKVGEKSRTGRRGIHLQKANFYP